MSGKTLVRFTLNGREAEAWAWPHQTLLEVLRDELGATEVKYGCGEGVCGTCTVLIDGRSVNACLLLAVQVEGQDLMTAKGLIRDGSLSRLQESFLEAGASQCGFCTPGMLLVAQEFLRDNPRASREDIRRAVSGNLCRCTGYTKIVDAIEAYVLAEAGHGGEGRPRER